MSARLGVGSLTIIHFIHFLCFLVFDQILLLWAAMLQINFLIKVCLAARRNDEQGGKKAEQQERLNNTGRKRQIEGLQKACRRGGNLETAEAYFIAVF